MSSHPEVSGVLIVGDRRFQPAAMIEPKSTISNPDQFIDRLWPLIEKANMEAQGHGLLIRPLVTVIEPSGFIRAPKGTIVRQATSNKYSAITKRLYSEQGYSKTLNGPSLINNGDLESAVLRLVRECVIMIAKLASITNEDDLFICGLDSLLAIELIRTIKAGLTPTFTQQQLRFLKTSLVYQNPTVSKLGQAIHSGLSGNLGQHASKASDDRFSEWLLGTFDFPLQSKGYSNVLNTKRQGLSLVLVGSTGSLGSQILGTLLKHSKVKAITCLNRNSSAEEMTHGILGGLLTQSHVEVTFHTMSITEMSIDKLKDWRFIFNETDAVLYNAWTVDFNQPLAFFEPQLRSLATISAFLSSWQITPRLFFVSSLSSISNPDTCKGDYIISESVPDNSSNAMSTGYVQSKHVVERVLDKAVQQMHAPITILRLGQIAGAIEESPFEDKSFANSNIGWNEKELFPLIMITSFRLSLWPSNLMAVDWIPANRASQIIEELVLNDLSRDLEGERPLYVYNIVNPTTVTWQKILSTVEEVLDFKCPTIPLDQWIEELKHKDQALENAKNLPILKLLDYLEKLDEKDGVNKIIKTDNATKASRNMRELEPVNGYWLRQWFHRWNLHRN